MKTMKNTFKRTAVLMLAVIMTILCAACQKKQGPAENGASKPGEDLLLSWTENAQAKNALLDYVAAVTDENSGKYIPAEDRIAVFDLDGTLMCETYPRCFEYMVFVDYVLNDPEYTPDDEVRAVAQEIVDTKW